MADNTTLPTGTGGDIISTDVITTLNGAGIATGEKAQRVKVGWGVDGTFNDTTAANPLPVTNSSLPLPTGASTSAKQAAPGTAGTASTDVLSVQGIASMTPLKVDGSAVTQPISGNLGVTDGTNISNVVAGDTGLNGLVTAGSVKTYSFTTSSAGAQTLLANTSTEGFSWVEIVLSSVGTGLAWTAPFATTSGGTYITTSSWGTSSNNASTSGIGATAGVIYFSPVRGNFIQLALSALTSGTVTGTLTLRAVAPGYNALAATQSGTWTVQPGNTANTTAWKVDGSAVTQPVSMATNTPTLQAGSAIVGKVGIDQTTPGTTNLVAANLTQINGSAISATNPLPTTQVAPTGNGFTPYKLINAATTNATNVKASAGDVGGIQVYNNSGVVAYFKLYDKASAPTVGSDTPVKTIIVPANTSGAGTNVSFASPGISFANGISFALTTGITDADTGAIASANTISINIDYK